MQSKVCKEKIRLGRGDCEILDKMYKNAEMGSSSIIDIMPKVEDDSLRAVLTAQLAGYDEWSRRTSEMLCCGGVEPKEENIVARAGAKIGMAMNTMIDTTTSHIADMVIKGSNMGITDLTKLINKYGESEECSKDVLSLAKEMREFEEMNLEKVKPYL